MGKFSKWLGAGVGFALGGVMGSILGFVVGNFIEGLSEDDIAKAGTTDSVQPGDFEVSLLILSSVVIKADGKISREETGYVQNYFKKVYGVERANQAFRLFKGFVKYKDVSVNRVCHQIRSHITHAGRLEIIHFLFGIANADRVIKEVEISTIRTIANYLNISLKDFESIQAMFVKNESSLEAAYKILEVSKYSDTATIKKAYRTLVKKYHPDKLKSFGNEHYKIANEKFIAVQKAYELIMKK